MNFEEFLKVFDAYRKYMQNTAPAASAPAASAPAASAPAASAPAASAPALDPVLEALNKMEVRLNQMQTPLPSQEIKPVSVDDVIAKIFE